MGARTFAQGLVIDTDLHQPFCDKVHFAARLTLSYHHITLQCIVMLSYSTGPQCCVLHLCDSYASASALPNSIECKPANRLHLKHATSKMH
jgi:hypothetical protein